ncbi:MAG: heterodisulfide reductase subunit B [Euryarchaeota archaeon]|nr:heterodisulfide reductase subunit B [Euryarchaeota archaeon]
MTDEGDVQEDGATQRLRYAYFPGCSLEASAREYDMATREVFNALDVELVDIDWNCCGATAASSTDHLLGLALPARNLALAEKEGLDITSPCPECYMKTWMAGDAARSSPDTGRKIREALGAAGLEYKGGIAVKHILEILARDVGPEAIREKVKTPLHGLKAAPYYGCLIVRPPRDDPFDSPEDPGTLEEVIRLTGARPIRFQSRLRCCGGTQLLPNEELFMKMTYAILKDARDSGADFVVTACPLCHMALDAKQKAIAAAYQDDMEMPVLYLTQLLGLALGIEPRKLGLDKNLVSTKNLIKSLKAQ